MSMRSLEEIEEEEGKIIIDTIIKSKEKYLAASNDKWEDFVEVPEMIPMTLALDAPIHMAVNSENKKILERLLRESPSMVDEKNAYENTALHVAAVTGNLEVVELLVKSKPELLKIRNRIGETPIFKAAAFGQTKMVKYLASQPHQRYENGQLLRTHRWREKPVADQGTSSILHIAIEGEHFDTALELLKLDESPVSDLENEHGMTCLQLLANMPSAFKSGYPMGILMSILYFCLPIHEDDDNNDEVFNVKANDTRANSERSINLSFIKKFNLSIWKHLCEGLPKIEKIWEAKKKHEFALKLAKKLIKKDKSWATKHTITDDSSLCYRSVVEEENDGKEKRTQEFASNLAKLPMKQDLSCVNYDISSVKEGQRENQLPTSAQGQRERQPPTSVQGQGESQSKRKNTTETPLLLATRNGIVEIVKEIIEEFPQAVEHCSHKGQNILLLAVKYRQKEIFDYVKKTKKPMRALGRGIDINGFTLLHHAARLDTKGTSPGPALQLQEELKWFKRAEKYIPSHYARHVDKNDKKTAKQLFKDNHREQLNKAQKWIKETSQSCSAVAVLIATVVFAAAYTVPGGSNDKGLPVFLNSPFFLFFTIMDVVSLASSLTSVVMFLSVLTSPSELEDFYHSLPQKLMIGFTLLFFSVTTTMLAFTATLVLIIQLDHLRWTTTLMYVAAFFPVIVFALMQFPLYAKFMVTLISSFKKVKKRVFPLFCKNTKAKHIIRSKKKSITTHTGSNPQTLTSVSNFN